MIPARFAIMPASSAWLYQGIAKRQASTPSATFAPKGAGPANQLIVCGHLGAIQCGMGLPSDLTPGKTLDIELSTRQ